MSNFKLKTRFPASLDVKKHKDDVFAEAGIASKNEILDFLTAEDLDDRYPDIYNEDSKVTLGSEGSESMHTINGYVRQNSPLIPLNAAGDEVLNVSLQSSWRKTGGSATITFANFMENQTITLVMESIGSPYALAFAGEQVRWQGGIVPTPSPSANVFDVYTFIKIGGFVYGNAMLGAS